MKRYCVILTLIVTYFSVLNLNGQDGILDNGKISGNFQLDMQSYSKDSLIGAEDIGERVLSNGFLWLTYSSNNFNAGIRYENYLNPILGIDKRYQGNGIAFRYGELLSENIDITAGNFYEQFGSGMIFRSYQEYALGFDNAMDGLRVKFRPAAGVEFIGIIGKQRKFWTTGEGIVRGGDINININDLFTETLADDLQLSVGGSVVSKYQKDVSTIYKLPQNVLLWAGRFSLTGSSFSVDGEYGFKNMDPNSINLFNYNPGNAFLLNASYFTEGLGVSLNFHRNDNMDVRSDRNVDGNLLLLNFLPPLTKQHTYALASMYPYATQLDGEIGYQAELTYTFPRNTLFGGEYGTTLNMNFSMVNSIEKNITDYDDSLKQIRTYDSPFFKFGDENYFTELHLEISKKFSKEIKTIFTLLNQAYNRDIVEALGANHYGIVNNNIIIADLTYKITSEYAVRTELQYMLSKQDSAASADDRQYGDWAAGLVELTISPYWYFSVTDQWNLGNTNDDLKIHYLTGAVTYVLEATRISFGFGRQRAGIICVGGVCRTVPASNGFFLNLSSSF